MIGRACSYLGYEHNINMSYYGAALFSVPPDNSVDYLFVWRFDDGNRN